MCDKLSDRVINDDDDMFNNYDVLNATRREIAKLISGRFCYCKARTLHIANLSDGSFTRQLSPLPRMLTTLKRMPPPFVCPRRPTAGRVFRFVVDNSPFRLARLMPVHPLMLLPRRLTNLRSCANCCGTNQLN